MICQAQNQKAVKMALANEKKTLHETFKNWNEDRVWLKQEKKEKKEHFLSRVSINCCMTKARGEYASVLVSVFVDASSVFVSVSSLICYHISINTEY
jgi:hypothetical protein